ncbi:hypothetical protein AGOR_G00170750 [Albula goreensis]|uniref:Leucine zipper protein 2 n=1 Tax=Albula goreensis TaxID=1534307 RepID=A0A8T3D386_9TELE|nr:hypothetical protein AGOR_G00170750 [Albula goreensis]
MPLGLRNCDRQGYEGLERKLREVFAERAGTLSRPSKTSKELDSLRDDLQSRKNGKTVPKHDVQRILELSQKQREEMKSLQAALQKQLDKAAESAQKQQATISFLKMEMERKTKIIKDLQQENKSLKMKLLSGNKLCGIHSQESKKIQAQMKELRHGKKDLVFKGQQLMDLERKLTVAKEELEMAALDNESQLKALKDTAALCFSSVLHGQPSNAHGLPSTPPDIVRHSAIANNSRVTYQQPNGKDIPEIARIVPDKTPLNLELVKKGSTLSTDCQAEEKSQEKLQVHKAMMKSSEDNQKTETNDKEHCGKTDTPGRQLKEWGSKN